jgi:hypothetical protein
MQASLMLHASKSHAAWQQIHTQPTPLIQQAPFQGLAVLTALAGQCVLRSFVNACSAKGAYILYVQNATQGIALVLITNEDTVADHKVSTAGVLCCKA